MIAKLIVTDPCSPAQEICLDQLPVQIGRGTAAAIRIEDRWLSRQHCELAVEEGRLVVRDLHSKHGTFVNDERVDEARLQPGDRLRIGLSEFRAEYESAELATAH